MTLRARRKAARDAVWRKAQAERHLQVACCHKCHSWFRTVKERNKHRPDCPKAKRSAGR